MIDLRIACCNEGSVLQEQLPMCALKEFRVFCCGQLDYFETLSAYAKTDPEAVRGIGFKNYFENVSREISSLRTRVSATR